MNLKKSLHHFLWPLVVGLLAGCSTARSLQEGQYRLARNKVEIVDDDRLTISEITPYIKQQAKPEYEDSYYEFLTNMSGTTVMGASSVNADSQDSLYDDVVEFVRTQQKASTSLLQRRFGIGYNRAARLIDTLEDRGVIGPSNGSKPREVYLKEDDEEE